MFIKPTSLTHWREKNVKRVLLNAGDVFVPVSNHLNSKAHCTLLILFLWLPWKRSIHIITHKPTILRMTKKGKKPHIHFHYF